MIRQFPDQFHTSFMEIADLCAGEAVTDLEADGRVPQDAPYNVSRAILVVEFVTPAAKSLAAYGAMADGSALTEWDASALLLHQLKEALHGR